MIHRCRRCCHRSEGSRVVRQRRSRPVQPRDSRSSSRYPRSDWYGFRHGTPGFKMAVTHCMSRSTPTHWTDAVTEGDLSLLRGLVRRCFPTAEGTRYLRRSAFSPTPDEHFILDRLPEAPAYGRVRMLGQDSSSARSSARSSPTWSSATQHSRTSPAPPQPLHRRVTCTNGAGDQARSTRQA